MIQNHLITHPDNNYSPQTNSKRKKSLRITKNLIRLSVGLEDPNDLLMTLINHLKKLKINYLMKKKYKVSVLVEPIYLEDHSDPHEDSYLWAYKVKIKNNE